MINAATVSTTDTGSDEVSGVIETGTMQRALAVFRQQAEEIAQLHYDLEQERRDAARVRSDLHAQANEQTARLLTEELAHQQTRDELAATQAALTQLRRRAPLVAQLLAACAELPTADADDERLALVYAADLHVLHRRAAAVLAYSLTSGEPVQDA